MSQFDAFAAIRKELSELRGLMAATVRQSDETLDYEGAARYLKLQKGTLQNMVSSKKVPHCKIGGKVLFYRSDLDRWIELHRVR